MAADKSSRDATSLTIDSRDTRQKLVVPATLDDLPHCISLTLRDYYEENRAIAIDFINSIRGCQRIHSLDVSLNYGTEGMNFGRWSNVEELSLSPGTWAKSPYPDLSAMKRLRRLVLFDHIEHTSAHSAEAFVNQLALLPSLHELRWWSCPLSNLEVLGRLSGVELLQIRLRSSGTHEYQMPSCIADMPTLKTFAIELTSFQGDRRSFTDGFQLLRPPKDWSSYSSLARLDVHDTNLATLDMYLELTRALPSVELICGPNFRDAAHALAKPPAEVTELNLTGLNLTAVPDVVKTCVNLKKLVLDGGISPESFENIPAERLEELSADCALSFFPPAIAKLTSLKSLCLGGAFGTSNTISEIPEWIGDLQSLETLWLAGNQISRFPSSVSRCSQLTTLVLFNDDGDYRHGNPICRDSMAIAKLKGWLPHATIVIGD